MVNYMKESYEVSESCERKEVVKIMTCERISLKYVNHANLSYCENNEF